MGYSGAGLTLLTLAQPPSSPDLDPVVFLLLLLISAFSHTCLHLLVPMDAALFFFFRGLLWWGRTSVGKQMWVEQSKVSPESSGGQPENSEGSLTASAPTWLSLQGVPAHSKGRCFCPPNSEFLRSSEWGLSSFFFWKPSPLDGDSCSFLFIYLKIIVKYT